MIRQFIYNVSWTRASALPKRCFLVEIQNDVCDSAFLQLINASKAERTNVPRTFYLQLTISFILLDRKLQYGIKHVT